MSLTIPKPPVRWATDDTYDAGSDEWSGQPNKVAPSAGRIEQGFVPRQGFNGPENNYQWRNWSDWLHALQHLGWFNFTQNHITTYQLQTVLDTAVHSIIWDSVRQLWLAIGESGGLARLAFSRNGADWRIDGHGGFGAAGGMRVIIVSPSAPGRMVVSGHTVDNGAEAYVYHSDTILAAWNQASAQPAVVPTSGITVASGCYFNSLFLLGGEYDNGDDVEGIWTSPTGDVWTSRTVPDAAGGGRIKQLVPGGGVCLAIGVNGGAGVDQHWVSTNGTVWTAVLNTAHGSQRIWHACWSDHHQEFLAFTHSGDWYASDDGITWTLRGAWSGPAVSSNDFADGGLLAVGPYYIAKFRPGSIDEANGGATCMAISADQGATWQGFAPSGVPHDCYNTGFGAEAAMPSLAYSPDTGQLLIYSTDAAPMCAISQLMAPAIVL